MMERSHPSDSVLVASVRSGSADAAGLLFDRYWRDAWLTAYRITQNRTVADDVAQDAFVAAVRSIGRFEERSTFRTWLQRIVVNHSLNAVRSRRFVEVQESEISDDLVDEFSPVAAAVRAAVRSLSGERRIVIVLRFWIDLSIAEIAEYVGVPEGTVHSRISRGLNELREKMEVEDVRRYSGASGRESAGRTTGRVGDGEGS